MLIDWFTVFAQVVNFLILIAILKRFLYGPIIKAMKADVMSSTRRAALPVERITALIWKALEHPRPRTRYPVPLSWLIGWFFPRRLPARVFDRLVAKRLGIM